MKYELDKICKHSIRYSLADRNAAGPATIYMPNAWFDDVNNPPKTIKVDIKVG